MTRYLVTETCVFIIEAETSEEAEALFLDKAALDLATEWVGVVDRDIQEAD